MYLRLLATVLFLILLTPKLHKISLLPSWDAERHLRMSQDHTDWTPSDLRYKGYSA